MIVAGRDIHLERRLQIKRRTVFVVPIVSVLVALALGAIFLALTGHPPLRVYQELFRSGFGNWYGFTDTLAGRDAAGLHGTRCGFRVPDEPLQHRRGGAALRGCDRRARGPGSRSRPDYRDRWPSRW